MAIEFTYDPTSDVGRVRRLLADTQAGDASGVPIFVWTDAEIADELSRNSNVHEIAASILLEGAAVDKARLSRAVKIGSYGLDERSAATAMGDRAKRLREIAPANIYTDPPDEVFVMPKGSDVGTMSPW